MRDKNYGAAAGLYSWLCDSRKHATSCVKMGMLELSARAAATQAQMSPDGIVIGDAGAGAAVGAAGAATAGSKRLAPNGCRALERFKQACELGEPAGCHNAGLVLKTGRDGAVKDVGKAVEYFDKACNGNDPWGCKYTLLHGTAPAPVSCVCGCVCVRLSLCDFVFVHICMYLPACAGGGTFNLYANHAIQYQPALVLLSFFFDLAPQLSKLTWHTNRCVCINAANIGFYMGLMTANVKNDPALTTDKPRALAYWSKACNIGTTTPCVWGCRNAHVMLQNGDGVPKDVEKAAELKARALQIIEASK